MSKYKWEIETSIILLMQDFSEPLICSKKGDKQSDQTYLSQTPSPSVNLLVNSEEYRKPS